jgi:hypothetical protein
MSSRKFVGTNAGHRRFACGRANSPSQHFLEEQHMRHQGRGQQRGQSLRGDQQRDSGHLGGRFGGEYNDEDSYNPRSGGSSGNQSWRGQPRDEDSRFESRESWEEGGQRGYGMGVGDWDDRSGNGRRSASLVAGPEARGRAQQRDYGPYDDKHGWPDQSARRDSQMDDDYNHWREQQLGKFDEDYKSWRDERRQKFSDDFGKWREERASKSSGTMAGDSKK